MRLDLSGQLTTRTLVERVTAAEAADAAHNSLPLREIAKAAGVKSAPAPSVPGQPGPHPLCQAAFALPLDTQEGAGPLDAFRCQHRAPAQTQALLECMMHLVQPGRAWIPPKCMCACTAASAAWQQQQGQPLSDRHTSARSATGHGALCMRAA